jgi:hypothetical protein
VQIRGAKCRQTTNNVEILGIERRKEMEAPVLTDKNQSPTEEVIYSHIGKTKSLWLSLFEYIHANHADFSEEWRYYNDGKSWLLKVTRKKKTVFWLSIVKNAFRTTFYLNDRAKQAVAGSSLSRGLKEQFVTGRKFGSIRGLTITYKRRRDVADAKELIAIKLAAK